MTKKVVQFRSADARPGRGRGKALSPETAPADAWVGGAGAPDAPAAEPAMPEPAPVQQARPSDLAESLGLLSREMSSLARAPVERHLTAFARLASARNPLELAAAQAELARRLVTGALLDAARLGEATARASRAVARSMDEDDTPRE